MNKKSKTIVLVVAGLGSGLALAFAATRAISGAARPARHAQTAAVKKASEQFKNIQVLRDLPADQLYPAMHFMADSLGIECVDCHVGVPGQVDGEKDDKQMKRTAREMIKMTMEINKANFDGHNNNHTVTCYTCHRGSRQPVAIPAISDPDSPKVQSQADLPTSDQILDRYFQAIGGLDRVQKITTRIEKGNVVSGDNKIPFEIFAKRPNKRAYIRHTANGDSASIFDGASGWLTTPDGVVRDMTALEASAEKIDADFSLALNAKQVFQQIRVSARELIGDKQVYAVTARTPGLPPVRLYFDAQTGLLMRTIRYTDVGLGLNPVQTDFDDYRDTNGIKIPFRWTTASPNSRTISQVEYIQQNIPIGDSKFAKPSAAVAVK